MESRVLRVLMVLRVNPEMMALMEPRERLACQEDEDQEEKTADQDNPDHRDHQAQDDQLSAKR